MTFAVNISSLNFFKKIPSYRKRKQIKRDKAIQNK